VIAVPSPAEVLRRGEAGEQVQPAWRPDIRRLQRGFGGPAVRLRLWNIGSGPAIVERVSLSPPGGRECLADLPDGFAPVGPQQVGDLEIPSPEWPSTTVNGTLTISYTHASGRRYQTRSVAVIHELTVVCATYERSCP